MPQLAASEGAGGDRYMRLHRRTGANRNPWWPHTERRPTQCSQNRPSRRSVMLAALRETFRASPSAAKSTSTCDERSEVGVETRLLQLGLCIGEGIQ